MQRRERRCCSGSDLRPWRAAVVVVAAAAFTTGRWWSRIKPLLLSPANTGALLAAAATATAALAALTALFVVRAGGWGAPSTSSISRPGTATGRRQLARDYDVRMDLRAMQPVGAGLSQLRACCWLHAHAG
jgi:hypothetical protein